MGSEDDWTWAFAPRAAEQFEDLEHHVRDRIVSKLDEIVDDPGVSRATTSNRSPADRSRSFASASTDSRASPITTAACSRSIVSNTAAGPTPPTIEPSVGIDRLTPRAGRATPARRPTRDDVTNSRGRTLIHPKRNGTGRNGR